MIRHAYRTAGAELEARRYRAAAPPAPGGAPAPGGQAASQAAPVAPWPFPVGVFDQEVQNSYTQTVTATTATVQFPDVEIEPDGWSRGWWFEFQIKATTNTATVGLSADFPFNGVNTVLLKGTNVPQTFGPFNGYDWENIDKYGGYQSVGDPRNDQVFSTTTGSATTSGSATWIQYLPLEISQHDALGDLQNQSDNSVYRVALTLESTAVMYTTTPSGTITCTVNVEQDSYSEPVAALALSGRAVMDAPPVPGTRQCWQQESDTGIINAAHTTKITNGIGYAYRNVILKLTNASGVRATGETYWPDPLELWLGGTRIKRQRQDIWKSKIGRRFRLTTTTADTANGPENGVRVWNWDSDVNIDPGNDARRKLLRTQDGNVFKIYGSYGGTGTLWMNSNYVIPRGGPQNNSQIVA
jgi:hypothetical protein